MSCTSNLNIFYQPSFPLRYLSYLWATLVSLSVRLIYLIFLRDPWRTVNILAVILFVQIAGAFKKSRPKPGTKLYLYKLKIETTEIRPEISISRAWFPETARYGVGLLSRKPLPLVSILGIHQFSVDPSVLVNLLLTVLVPNFDTPRVQAQNGGFRGKKTPIFNFGNHSRLTRHPENLWGPHFHGCN